MTIWMPDISSRQGPKYRAIADAIIQAVNDGDLPSGEKLPPQRNLAYDLGVTLGTVTRAYQEVERAGLARGEVGRGTFVLPEEQRPDVRQAAAPFWIKPENAAFDPAVTPVDHLYANPEQFLDGYELAPNYPHLSGTAEAIAESMRRVARPDMLSASMQYRADNGLPHHRIAGVHWMRGLGIHIDADHILVTPGAQAATQTSLIALTRPGDTVLVEQLTWPGMKATAAPLGINLKAVAMDELGMMPDAFEAACRDHAPKAAYILPTLHNPTASVMPDDRRRAIAEIAERHGVYLIEDDVYGFLLDEEPAPLFTYTPRYGIYLTSLSKAVAPGLRIGYTVVPDGLMPKFIGAMRTNVLMASPINGEIAAEMIGSGSALELAQRQRDEIRIRQTLVERHLGHLSLRRHPASSHCWMPVPDGFADEHAFRACLMEHGVSVTPGSVFAVDENEPLRRPHIRICLGAEPKQQRLEDALKIIAEVAATKGASANPVV